MQTIVFFIYIFYANFINFFIGATHVDISHELVVCITTVSLQRSHKKKTEKKGEWGLGNKSPMKNKSVQLQKIGANFTTITCMPPFFSFSFPTGF